MNNIILGWWDYKQVLFSFYFFVFSKDPKTKVDGHREPTKHRWWNSVYHITFLETHNDHEYFESCKNSCR